MKEQMRHPCNGAGSRYKSKAETQLARLFEREHIQFRYEYPLAVVDRGKTRIWYPDFQLPEYGIIVEYFGVNGDSDYDKQSQHKEQVYQDSGIDVLCLSGDCLKGDWPTQIMGQIESILKNRLERFCRRQQKGREGQKATSLHAGLQQ